MKLIKPKAELLLQQPGLEGVYKQIELAGRTCYKSTDKITEDSAKPFVDRMIKSNHLAMLEHGTVYLIIKWWHILKFFKYLLNPYSKIRRFKYITTNLRVIKERNWDKDLKYICEPAAGTVPESLLEMQKPKYVPRPTEPVCVLTCSPGHLCEH
jgi:thymidylate synthase (FAD)